MFVIVTENTKGGFGVAKEFTGYNLRDTFENREEALAFAAKVGGFVHEMTEAEFDAVDDKYHVQNVPGTRLYV